MTIPASLETGYLENILTRTGRPSNRTIKAIIEKAGAKKGLSLEDVGHLVNLKDPQLINYLFRTASQIKQDIYGERLVFFAPLYVSDYCVNDCEYCNFHSRNKELKRRQLSLEEVEEQTKFLINEGHKRILLEAGEDPVNTPIDYIADVIKKIYSVR